MCNVKMRPHWGSLGLLLPGISVGVGALPCCGHRVKHGQCLTGSGDLGEIAKRVRLSVHEAVALTDMSLPTMQTALLRASADRRNREPNRRQVM